jgi:hypothetical protein
MALMALKAHTFFRANRQWETLTAHKALKAHTSTPAATVPGPGKQPLPWPRGSENPFLSSRTQFFTPHEG